MKIAGKTKKWLIVLLVLAVGYALIPKPELLGDVSFSQAFYAKDGELLRLTTSKDQKYRLYTPLKRISPEFIEATLLYEDKYFYYHPGVNPISIIRAFYETYVAKNRKIGASTITMQLTRLKYNINSRTITGKLLQILKSLQIERHYSKDEILEAYLNLAPYGGNIEGIGAASLAYYKKKPDNLKLIQAITLATVPQDPVNLNPLNSKNEKRNILFSKWVKQHPEDNDKAGLLNLPQIVYTPKDLPFLAPHYTDELMSKNTTPSTVQTTIDLDLQTLINQSVKDFVKNKEILGIKNAAVMLVNFKNMQTNALIGSSDFFERSIQGQVNGTNAKRSPGSTLKPFIYALALEQGLIHPMSLLKDAPSSLGDYNPENFDKDFRGPMSATDALVLSRNVPAIYLASKLKTPDLYEFLQYFGVKGLKDKELYGHSLVLGGAELTMKEIVSLYCMLANKGKSDQVSFISKEAAFLTLYMLGHNNTYKRGIYTGKVEKEVPVYWKTGTSNSYRDAWAVGVFGPYVLCVWIGNFDGSSNPAFIGSESAAELFFNIINAVKQEKYLQDEVQKDIDDLNIKKLEICSSTGDIDTSFCPRKTYTWFIPGKSPIKSANIYRKILIDNKTGKRACIPDVKNNHYEVYEFWSSDLLKIYNMAGISKKTPPIFLDECMVKKAAIDGKKPVILSPVNEMEYNISLKNNENKDIALRAVTDSDVKVLYWFIDKNYIGKSDSENNLSWELKPGLHTISVIDDKGRSNTSRIKVSSAE